MLGVATTLAPDSPVPRVILAEAEDTPDGTRTEQPAQPCACPMEIPDTFGVSGFGVRMIDTAGAENQAPIVHRQ